ncbi:MAG: NADH-quinone oxidoreductase subunit NuoB, partial [Gammaproteobacteria bacterium]|nr:NADH-quinone oxidoreductase subunit NuoB [Gammaproteobacteria bacterium]
MVFAGTPAFAATLLSALLAAKVPLVGVLSQPDRPAGRGRKLTASPVKSLALEAGLPVATPPSLRKPEHRETLEAWAPDLMIVAGRVSQKMAPVLRQIYDQMPNPKWVLAMGVCASSGGMFNNYAVVQGVDHVVPVDMYLPGCPPRPEMLIDAIL